MQGASAHVSHQVTCLPHTLLDMTMEQECILGRVEYDNWKHIDKRCKVLVLATEPLLKHLFFTRTIFDIMLIMAI